MKIYVASSWRNKLQPGVVHTLRTAGHEVYDFRNPPGKAGFAWEQITRGGGAPTLDTYAASLAHPDALAGFRADFDGMEWADACVLALPCGRSAHFEAGWFWGKGKPVHILLSHDGFEPELMYLGATTLHYSLAGMVAALGCPADGE